MKNNQNALSKISTKPEMMNSEYLDQNDQPKTQTLDKTKTLFSSKYSKTEKNLLKTDEKSKVSYGKLQK